MSAHPQTAAPAAAAPLRRVAIPDLRARKGKTPIVVLTCYTAPMATLLDPHVDVLLVGDSLGMVVYGFDSTLPVTLEMMIAHGAAVVRGSRRAAVVVDLPFASYQESPQQAFRSAARVMQETGCAAVKLEGGAEMADTIDFLTQRGVPVMGHVGVTPQSVHTLGGYGARGKRDEEAIKLHADACAVADAGAFSIVIEGVVARVAEELTAAVAVPTIGIGASPQCDGQVLVTEDAMGLFSAFKPKFVRRFAELGGEVDRAAAAYADAVRARLFPGPENLYGVAKAERGASDK